MENYLCIAILFFTQLLYVISVDDSTVIRRDTLRKSFVPQETTDGASSPRASNSVLRNLPQYKNRSPAYGRGRLPHPGKGGQPNTSPARVPFVYRRRPTSRVTQVAGRRRLIASPKRRLSASPNRPPISPRRRPSRPPIRRPPIIPRRRPSSRPSGRRPAAGGRHRRPPPVIRRGSTFKRGQVPKSHFLAPLSQRVASRNFYHQKKPLKLRASTGKLRAGVRPRPGTIRVGSRGKSLSKQKHYFPRGRAPPPNAAWTGTAAGGVTPKNAGPNRCNGGRTCCVGWQINVVTRLCTVPVCSSPCGFGICRSPNLCQCMDGGFGSFCKNPEQKGGCARGCINGGVCQATLCVCRVGYVGTRCEKPVCKEPCLNNGRCIGPDRCACPYGYTGKRCEEDHRLGPCFTKIENNMCRNQLSGVKCTRSSCCSTVGAAWGVPCQRCPSKRDCERGMYRDPKTKKCVDINECRGIPNICAMGTCVNTVGSYRCECGQGRIYNPVKFECSDWNECTSGQRVCEFGKCINLDGSYKCECNPGMVLTEGGKRCVEPNVLGKCFQSFKDGCKTATNRPIRKKECCCKNPERAFNFCNKCPSKGTAEYRRLGCEPLVPPTPKVPKVCDPAACTDGTCVDGECRCNKNFIRKNGLCVPNLSTECDVDGKCKNGKCKIVKEQSVCECDEGFHSDDEGKCVKPADTVCKETGNCENGKCIGADRTCVCNDGYEKVNGVCRKIDQPCTLQCPNGKCVRKDGEEVCKCNPGFIETDDGECIEKVPPTEDCQRRGKCVNGDCKQVNGELLCVCKTGYGKGDNDECVKTEVCTATSCVNGQCYNNKCVCDTDYTLENGKCVKQTAVAKCALENICNNGRCVTDKGKPICICNSGFEMVNGICVRKEDASCKLTDACDNGSCAIQKGRAICVCNPGFTMIGGKCTRRESSECQTTGACKNGQCVTENGRDICKCLEGFKLNLAGDCSKSADEECKDGGACTGGTCIGGKCVCNKGFVKDINGLCVQTGGVQCTSGDTCSNGQCALLRGQKVCVCNEGFAMKNGVCTPTGGNMCELYGRCPNGVCEVINGKHVCTCNDGFATKHGFCVRKADGMCQLDGVCTNGRCATIDGKDRCICNDGYTMNRLNICTKITCPDGYTKDINGYCTPIPDPKCTTSGDCGNGYCLNNKCVCYDGFAKDINGVCKRPVKRQCGGLFDNCKNGKCVIQQGGHICLCNKGYKPDSNNICVDDNECEAGDGICKGGKCINTEGSFRCECTGGFTLGPDGICVDKDECNNPNICKNGVCKNTHGSYTCACNDGFVSGDGKTTCNDIDECQDTSTCTGNQKCVNLPGSYECQCADGFTRKDGKCADVNECELNKGLCAHGTCVDIVGSYTCTCDVGFKPSKDGKSCVDEDECTSIAGICKGGVCVNTAGSYRCKCNDGFKVSTDGTICVDERRSNCYTKYNPVTMECSAPTLGQWRKVDCCCSLTSCNKQAGWGDKGSCSPCPKKGTPEFKELCPGGCGVDPTNPNGTINECKLHMGMDICPNGRCIDLPVGYKCKCMRGFKHPAGSDKVCEDINECGQPGVCVKGSCTNTNGGYMCKCPEGFRLDYNTCVDVDECLDKPCTGGTCINTQGSYQCKCPAGYVLDGDLCRDSKTREGCYKAKVLGQCGKPIAKHTTIMECCGSGLGKYWGKNCIQCPRVPNDCPSGMKRMGEECVDINECDLFPNACENGQCINTKGGFICKCSEGWELDKSGKKCQDMRKGTCYRKKQCSMELGGTYTKKDCCCAKAGFAAWKHKKVCETCPLHGSDEHKALCKETGELAKIRDHCAFYQGLCVNGKCRNTNDSFTCDCDTGYGLDDTRTMCQDYDECKITKNICGPGVCSNTYGSFSCKCNRGYRNAMMMEMCVDINECEEMKPSPCQRGKCINLPGHFRCECPTGFQTMGDAIACEDIDECEDKNICTNGVCQNFLGGYHCACNIGYRPGSSMKKCYDIDECNLNKGGCEYDCTNTDGSYRCVCKPGFELRSDKRTCKDINECARGTPCGEGNKCTNTVGGHVCTCSVGFRLSDDRKACIDVDECQGLTCHNGDCINTAGSFECKCRVGYKLEPDAMACIDVDECKVDPDKCHKDARCINKVGSFECQCKPGYVGTGFECEDQDECAFGMANCNVDAQCVNTIGSFGCECKPGFSGDGEVCIDINECALNTTVCQPGVCMNTNGAFKCDCPKGYKASKDGKACIDVDECVEVPGTCNHGFCENTIGGHVCTCEVGFKQNEDKTACVDVDECESHLTCLHGECKNMMGMYKCVCNETQGYKANPAETACMDIRLGTCMTHAVDTATCSAIKLAENQMTKQFCCCTARRGAGWLETKTENMEACPIIGSTEYNILCPGGPSTYVDELTTKIVRHHDGCSILPNYCKGGTCLNNGRSGISCQCPDGYEFNECTKQCQDYNECETPGICGYGATCINQDKSYRCICPEGYTFISDKNFCQDLRKHLCFMADKNPDGCTTSTPENFTAGACCCSDGMQGNRFSSECKACPVPKTADYKVLCHGKPELPKPKVGEPPEVTPTNPPVYITNEKGDIVGIVPTDEFGITAYPTDRPVPTDKDGNPIHATYAPPKKTYAPVYVTNEKGEIVGQIPTDKNGVTLYKPDEPAPTGSDGVTLHATYPKPTNAPVVITDKDGNVIGVVPTGEDGVTLYKPDEPAPTGPDGVTLHATYPKPTNAPVLITDKDGNVIGVVPTGEDGVTLYKPGDPLTGSDGVTIYATYAPPDGGEPTLCPSCSINMCKMLPEQCGKGKCVNTVNGYSCDCDVGYQEKRMNGKLTCTDIDECAGTNPCDRGICHNFEGGFHCSCNEGMVLDKKDPTKCVDLNECEDPNYCSHGVCTNIPDGGGFTCDCHKGFIMTRDKKTCKDINECLMDGICGNGDCVNLNGTYACECYDGYELNALGKCEDKDECEAPEDVCEHGTCTNTDGSYRCSCDKGFQPGPEGTSCIDVDECGDASYCNNGLCVNTVGGATCTCNFGYKPTADGLNCEDRNECDEHADICDNGKCVNLDGTFECVCDKGFETTSNGKGCTDVNECSDPNFCANGKCTNLVGGATCSCNAGFNLTANNVCEDIDECSRTKNPPCRFGSISCVNTPGAFKCICREGFVEDTTQGDCVDTRKGYCFSDQGDDGLCENSNGKLVSKASCCCSMNYGWTGADGDSCELCPDKNSDEFKYVCPKGVGFDKSADINECAHNLGKCTNGVCKNTDGSYMCVCNKGFKQDTDRKCVDLDECTEIDNACGNGMATCTNTVGSFQCTCKTGYEPGTKTPACVDINECEGTNQCAFRCRNTDGSYECTCPRGFKVADNGIHCDDINECNSLLNGRPRCTFICKNLVGSYKCLCPPGFTRDSSGVCHDIDECAAPGAENLCKPGGNCQNVAGKFRCVCTAPFMKSDDEKHCLDKRMKLCFSNIIDGNCEVSTLQRMSKVTQAQCCCSVDTNAWGKDCTPCPKPNTPLRKQLCDNADIKIKDPCKYMMGICKNGKCMKTEKSFRCMCNDGYKLTMNAQKCEDKNECKDGTAKCPGTCKNTPGSYECICPKGLVINKDKTKCVDEDECATGKHDCTDIQKCVNTDGGYKCECPNGYRLMRDVCTDINECLEKPGICGIGHCENIEGAYRCNCGRGLKFDREKATCVYIDIDPTPTPETPICTNPQLGCGCPQGFFPYFNVYGIHQCVDVNECRQGLCGQSSCKNTLGSYQCSCPPGFQFKDGQCQDLNECSRSPCSYGCSNNRGGFACQCPPGFYPVSGGHCVATHGVHCVTCDTSDIPQEGVPLSDGNEPIISADAGGSSTAGQTFQSPIDSNRQSPLTDGAVTRQQGSSNNVHYFPNNQREQDGLNRYTPEDPYTPDAYAPQGQYQDQGDYYDPDYGTGYDQYDQYDTYDYTGYANRKRRSLTGKSNKPVKVTISRNAAKNTTLLKMVPLLRNMRGRMLYGLKHGDPRLFVLNTNNPGIFYLSTARKMDVGKYILGITGDYRRNLTGTVQQRKLRSDTLGEQYDPLFEGVQLSLKVVVRVV